MSWVKTIKVSSCGQKKTNHTKKKWNPNLLKAKWLVDMKKKIGLNKNLQKTEEF